MANSKNKGDAKDHPSGAIWQIVISATIALGLALLTAFWSLADPRAEIKNIEANISQNYLTIREHAEYRDRIQKDILRLEEQNDQQAGKMQVQADIQWLRQEIDQLRREMEAMQRDIHQHERDDRLLGKPNGGGGK